MEAFQFSFRLKWIVDFRMFIFCDDGMKLNTNLNFQLDDTLESDSQTNLNWTELQLWNWWIEL